ncbi:hypothetical protein N7448_009879 [Penicillium atrosanguineum]|uniref:Uncharacterized protein n=1 Tax=Penicillium atrosanguineum TaxID=1132637 RepID=A0A9W9GMJ4_9EURO|nr:hypothetical protein N7448_009879 [Penicillium atrosanguineum]KAJ5142409.1 hypothetical protein N7526_003404 [Penicillium atrosanguineum]KAJ5320727.1 hypothetical protein N7476_003729 [Penicillium atrosanguineum]
MRSKLVESDLSGGVIKIDVGVSKVPFDVHLELLCACSPYFESLFQQRFKQALSDEVLCFPDDDPPVFAQLILWMYRGNDSLETLKELCDNGLHRKDRRLADGPYESRNCQIYLFSYLASVPTALPRSGYMGAKVNQ